MKKLLLFDFDDTLCMTEELCFHAENNILIEMGHPPMSREVHQANWGMKLEEAIPYRAPGVDVVDFMKRVKKFVQKNVGIADTIPSANLTILKTLKQRGYRLGLLTSRNRLELSGVLNTRHPLNELMEGFYYLENCTHHKPDPRVFDNALKDFQYKPQEVVYIGDAIGDAKAAIGAGITFVATIEGGIRTREDFEDIGADYIIENLEEMLALFVGK